MGRIGATEILIMLIMVGVVVAIIFGVVVPARGSTTTQNSYPATPGQWAPDPTGRHQLRWFDGSRWTSSVSDAGVLGHDPI